MLIAFVFAAGAIVCALLGVLLLEPSGQKGTGFFLGLVLGPLGVLVAAVIRLSSTTPRVAPNAPRGNVSIAKDGIPTFELNGLAWVRSYRYIAQGGDYPTDAAVVASGVVVEGRFRAVPLGRTLSSGESIYATFVPFSGPRASGTHGQGIRFTTTGPGSATKKCPDCAESILAEARKCRYCGADVG